MRILLPTINLFLLTLLHATLTLQAPTQQRSAYGLACAADADCATTSDSSSLRCTPSNDNAITNKRCQCAEGLVWSADTKCAPEDLQSEKAARIITIVVPILGATFVILCLSCMCCYWFHAMSRGVKKRDVGNPKYDDKELDIFRQETDVDDEDVKEEEEEDIKPSIKIVDETVRKAKKKKKPAVTVKETVLAKEPEPDQVPQDVEPPAGQASAETPIKSSQSTLFAQHPFFTDGGGYQSSMRRVLTMPQMHSEPCTRPPSSGYLSNSRPGTARRSVSVLLNPRERAFSALGGRLSPGIIGPYVTDASLIRPRSPNPAVTSPPPPPAESPVVELAELYDEVAEVAAEEEKEKEKAQERRKRELSGKAPESSRLITVAVTAFKRRRNMKKVKEEQRRRRKREMEDLVGQIMRLREEEDAKQAKLAAEGGVGGKSRRESRSSDGSSSVGSKLPAGLRPESVAQRILRERQERQIRAKVPVTPKPKTAKPKDKAPLLHIALKHTASTHTSRAHLTEKLKQQVHLHAVRNYQAPADVDFESNEGGKQPGKSILKRGGGTKGSRKKKAGRVNYAFDDDKENR